MPSSSTPAPLIRAARPDEAALLSDLAFRSKAHWGYDGAVMERFRAALRIEPADCLTGRVVVADDGAGLAGFYSLAGDPPVGQLSDLFVDPDRIGSGIGRRLWDAALDHARRLGVTALEIHSDPHAEAFYLRMGAVRTGSVASESVPGRDLPLMTIRL